MVTFGQRSFSTIRGSDVARHRMYLELSEVGGKQGIVEVFFSDRTGEFGLNTFDNDEPLIAVKCLAALARSRLRPAR
jgi:hypothetical protein